MLEGSGMLAANVHAETRSDSRGKRRPPPPKPLPHHRYWICPSKARCRGSRDLSAPGLPVDAESSNNSGKPGKPPRLRWRLQPQPLAPLRSLSQHLMGGGCGEPLASAASITKPRASQMLRPKTRSMCECVSTSDRDVYSWQKEAAGVACDPADLLRAQRRAAGRLPGGVAGGEGRLGACRSVCSLTRTASGELQLRGQTPSTNPEHRPQAQTPSTGTACRTRLAVCDCRAGAALAAKACW